MPSAKIVTFARFPPVNMSYRPNIVFAVWRASSSSAAALMPGVGMNPPSAEHGEHAPA